MMETALAGRTSGLGFYLPRLALLLAILSLVLMILAPLGWRIGLWHFRVSFYYLLAPGALMGVAAGLAALVALLLWRDMGPAARAMALASLVVGALMFYLPWSYYRLLGTVPRIHDIATDTVTPPAFSEAVLAARAAERGNATAYDPKVAALQKQAYPDLAPMRTALPPAQAFPFAFATARSMSGWTIVDSDAATGMIEARQSSRFFGFTDDIAIRVAADGAGSRIDMRSESRQGMSDFGVNARRVRTYMGALQERLAAQRSRGSE